MKFEVDDNACILGVICAICLMMAVSVVSISKSESCPQIQLEEEE